MAAPSPEQLAAAYRKVLTEIFDAQTGKTSPTPDAIQELLRKEQSGEDKLGAMRSKLVFRSTARMWAARNKCCPFCGGEIHPFQWEEEEPF